MAVITLANYKTWAGIADTDDDGWLAMSIASVDRAIQGPAGVGFDLSPSADTTRDYDGSDAVCDGTRLHIPGGIRAFTAVSVSIDGGANFTAVTSDVRVGPVAHMRSSGEPGGYIEFKDWRSITGSYRWFPQGVGNVRIAGTTLLTFGWAAWPDDLVQAAYVAVQRMSRERDSQGAYPTETNAMRYLDKNLLASYRTRYFPPVR